MELIGEVAGIRIYDDFAHHPTAIKTTLAGLKAKVGSGTCIMFGIPCGNGENAESNEIEMAS